MGDNPFLTPPNHTTRRLGSARQNPFLEPPKHSERRLGSARRKEEPPGLLSRVRSLLGGSRQAAAPERDLPAELAQDDPRAVGAAPDATRVARRVDRTELVALGEAATPIRPPLPEPPAKGPHLDVAQAPRDVTAIGPRENSAPPASISSITPREEAEATAARMRRGEQESYEAIPAAVRLAGRFGRGAAEAPILGPAAQAGQEVARRFTRLLTGKTPEPATEYLDRMDASPAERAAEIVGMFGGVGSELAGTKALAAAAGEVLPAGRFARALQLVGSHEPTTPVRAVARGAVEGLPTDVAFGVTDPDISVPESVALGSGLGVLGEAVTASRAAEDAVEGAGRRVAERDAAHGAEHVAGLVHPNAGGIRRRVADIIDPSRKAELLEAYRDPLTGLSNETAFRAAKDRIDADPAREWLVLDAVGLKALNDAADRAAGDSHLRKIAQAALEKSGAADVGEREIFRTGGDEFPIAVPKGTGEELGRAIQGAVGEGAVPGTEFRTGVRYGVGDTFAEADAAAQAAKVAEEGPRYRDFKRGQKVAARAPGEARARPEPEFQTAELTSTRTDSLVPEAEEPLTRDVTRAITRDIEAEGPARPTPRERQDAPSPLAASMARTSEALPDAGAFTGARHGEKVQSPVKTIEELRGALSRALGGLKAAEGGVSGGPRMGTTLGILKPRPQVVRLQDASDVRVFAHEAGHALQKLLIGSTSQGGISDAMLAKAFGPELQAELKGLARGISDQGLAEGWAEYWRRYVDNPGALASAPKLDAWVNRALDAHPDVRAALDDARQKWQLYREGGAEARIDAKIRVGSDPRNLSIEDTWRRLRTDVLDRFEPIRVLVDHVRNGVGLKDLSEDAESLARLVAGAPGQAEHFLEFGPLEFRTLARARNEAGELVKPLREILEPVKDDTQAFRRYIASRRAQELEGRDILTGLRPEDAAEVVAKYAGPEGATFRQAFDELQDYQRASLRYLRDAGVISGEAYQRITEKNLAYIPMYRAMDVEGGFLGGGFGHLFSPVKRIRGSGKDLIDPLESIIKNTYLYTHLAARQQVSTALAKIAGKEGIGEFLEGLVKPIRPTEFQLGEIETQLREIFGDDLVGGLLEGGIEQGRTTAPLEELLAVFRPGELLQRPNAISVLEEGKRRYFEVDRDLYRALEGLDRESIGMLGKLAAIPAGTLRAGATLTPEFSARNVFRDQVMAFIQSEYGYRPIFDMGRGMFEILGKGDAYQQWLASGGQRASLLSLDRKHMANALAELTKAGGVKNVLKTPLDGLRALSSLMEDATRVGEFLRAREALGETKEALQVSALSSREVSIDFARHGAKLAGLRAAVAFWNARLQGYDRLARAFRSDPKGATMRAFAAITVPSILEYAAYRDDPDWWEIPQWQRDLFWMAKVGDSWVRIPKPFELGLIFGTLPQRIMAWMDATDPQGMRTFLGQTIPGEVQGVLPVPTALMPLVENWANYSAFLNRPIVPRSMEDVSSRYQSRETTSEAAKLLGRWANYSPLKIDNLLYGWTGGMGRMASEAVDAVVQKARGDVERPMSEAADIPVVRAFAVRDPGFNSESVERMYRLYSDAQQAVADLRFNKQEGNTQEYQRLASDPETARLAALEPELRRAADQMAGLRAQRELIYRDPELSAEEKRERVRELGNRAVAVAKAVVEDLGRVRSP